ncbi:hypothetical protein [Epibacterium sp. Ofav1-8]|uniref:hypothetical protein n=1 Tax=Epibacterium sp. Ofav1-8 TaxID=2917735 RepID=UPI001EF583B8|nr:hypothetical protein [Epibacterium sp. Ofav1-8]MCG7622016.1 hypothetical protein [Epibacterium sp. Ofav1-8]
MTSPLSAPQILADATVAGATDALGVLEDSWAYYSPEPPVTLHEVEAPQDGVVAYYEAA